MLSVIIFALAVVAVVWFVRFRSIESGSSVVRGNDEATMKEAIYLIHENKVVTVRVPSM